MSKVDRNNPVRGTASESQYSLMEFMQSFKDDRACLDFLWRQRHSEDGSHAHCPKCDRERKFHRVNDRPAYDCDTCGHHIHPTAGTIFHKSATSLHLWFYAMYIMASTRCGVSAKQLERELGVTYKTAWRMFNLIRNEVMADNDPTPLSGEVEADETFVGGKPRAGRPMPKNAHWDRKAMVFGAVERRGRIKVEVVPNSRAVVVQPKVREYVLPGSILFTDDFHAYKGLGRSGEYTHKRINHSARVYVQGDTHTNTIEGFFGLFKSGVRGAYHAVSHKWLRGYLNEYAWRYNRRDSGRAMFLDLIEAAASDVR